MTKYFVLEESPYHPGKYRITLDFNKFPPIFTSGSYNILPARLMNLSYAEYLRFCRDRCGGEIIGKGSLYPVVYFTKDSPTTELVQTLNTRMEVVAKNVFNSRYS